MKKKIITIILFLTLIISNYNNSVNAADFSSIQTTNKFFNVSEDLTFNNLFSDCIITNTNGRRLNCENTDLSIVKVVSLGKTNETVYDNTSGMNKNNYTDYIIPKKGKTYTVTVRVTIDGKIFNSIFDIYFWDYEAEYKYIREIDLDSLNSLSPISKWTTGTSAAKLKQSLYRSQSDEAIYKYSLSSNNVENIKKEYEDNDYSWNNLKADVKDIIKAVKFPTKYMSEHRKY